MKKMLLCGAALSLLSGWADIVLDEDLVIDGTVYTNLTENYSGPGGIRVTGGAPTNRIVSFSGYLTNSVEGSTMVISNAHFRDVTPISATADGSSMIRGAYNVITHRLDYQNYSTFECQYNESNGTSIKTVSLKLTQVDGNVVVSYGPTVQYYACKAVTNETTGVALSAREVCLSLLGVLDYHDTNDKSKSTPGPYTTYAKEAWGGNFAFAKKVGGGYGIVDPVFEVRNPGVRTANIPSYLPTTATCIFTNAYYLNVRPICAYVRGRSIATSCFGNPIVFCHRRDYVRTATSNPYSTYQGQFNESTSVKVVTMKIEQRGDDVYVYAAAVPDSTSSASSYISGFVSNDAAKKAVGVYDVQNHSAFPGLSRSGQGNPTTSDDATSGNYGMTNITFALSCEAVRISGNNTYEGETRIDNAYVVTDGGEGQGGIPDGKGAVIVTNGAFFVLNTLKNGVHADIQASSGSHVQLYGLWNTEAATRLTIDGGFFDNMNSDDYVRGIILRNGAELTGLDRTDRWFRLGSTGMDPYGYKLVRSEGAGTNVVSGTMMFYRSGGDYVSFETEADLLVTGGLLVSRDTPAEYALHRLYELLAGDLILRGRATNWAEWRLLEGVMRLEASDTLWASNSLYLAGGDLLCGANTSNGVAKISVNDAAQKLDRWDVAADSGGTVTFEPNAVLTVEKKGANWPLSGANQVTLKGELTNGNFRVGTTKCLSAGELAAFCYETDDGKTLKVLQDDEGYILPKPKTGVLIIFR